MPKVIECFGCDEKFVTTSAMILHLESGYCRCQIDCDEIKQLAYECYQAGHYTTGFDDKPFRCEDCNGQFSLMSALLQHVETDYCEGEATYDRPLGKFLNFLSLKVWSGRRGHRVMFLGSPSVSVSYRETMVCIRSRIFRLTFFSYSSAHRYELVSSSWNFNGWPFCFFQSFRMIIQALRPRKDGGSLFHGPCNFLSPGLVAPPINATGSSSEWVGNTTTWRLDLPEIQKDERRKGDRLQICVNRRPSSLSVPPLLNIGIFSTTLTHRHPGPLHFSGNLYTSPL